MYVSIECRGTTLSHVLVDTCSSLNVFPKAALDKLDWRDYSKTQWYCGGSFWWFEENGEPGGWSSNQSGFPSLRLYFLCDGYSSSSFLFSWTPFDSWGMRFYFYLTPEIKVSREGKDCYSLWWRRIHGDPLELIQVCWYGWWILRDPLPELQSCW